MAIQTLLGKHWHHLPAEEVVDLLETDPVRGLDHFEVEERQKPFGANVLTARRGHGPAMRFLLQFHQPLVYILLVSALVTVLLREWVDAGVIFGVVLVNAVVGFMQEGKALKAIEALRRAMGSDAVVVRAGERRRIGAAKLVPGDLVLLQPGDKVPADLRLLRCRDLQIDESSLTGESMPVGKHGETLEHDIALADRRNMAYSSTLVTRGSGAGIVVAIGDETEIGRVSEMIAGADVLSTPLTRKMAAFSHVLLYVILTMGALTFAVGRFQGQPWVDMFMATVALAVAAIPEGLPAAMTITLAIGVARMARRHAIIRHLPAVETLGSTTVICSDKTGTLTQNQMTVRAVFAGGRRFAFSGIGYDPAGAVTERGKVIDATRHEALMECLRAGLYCNDAILRRCDEGWRVEGDPTEGALTVAAFKAGLADDGSAFPRIDAIPFDAEYQYMATLHDRRAGLPPLAYMKGSVERVLVRCARARSDEGEEVELDAGAIHRAVEEMAAEGLRVLAFARTDLAPGKVNLTDRDLASGLVFLGLQGMLDPPRAEAMSAVKTCRRAGIAVKMITGDHARTAQAIAASIGLLGADQGEEGAVMTGKALARLTDDQLVEAVKATAVFARVAPEQKLRLVEALQAGGEVVAMTGDGINDAPALRRADIGVAMGIAGTDVAKEAADMVLTDDNFSSIEAAVEEGRGVFDNLVKFITWTLPTNLGEGLVIMASVFTGVQLPVLPVQILWINMTTAVCLGMMLVFEPKEAGIMRRPPRRPQMPLLSPALVFRIFLVGFLLLAGVFALFEWELLRGAGEAEARTVAVNMFVMGELFYLFNCRSLTRSLFAVGILSNLWLLAGVVAMVLLQVLFTYSPAMNLLFHTAPIGLAEWGYITLVGFCIYAIVGLEKWGYRVMMRRRPAKAPARPTPRPIPISGPAVRRFLQIEAAGGFWVLVLLGFLLLLRPTSADVDLLFSELELRFGDWVLHQPLLLWINQGLMAFLFLLVGMEAKKALMAWSCPPRSFARLPLYGALGGLVLPLLIAHGLIEDSRSAWHAGLTAAAVDMAVALAVLFVLGDRVAFTVKLFFLGVATAENLGAVMLAVPLLGDTARFPGLAAIGATLGLLLLMNRLRVGRPTAYVFAVLPLWAQLFAQGLPAASVGILAAVAIPVGSGRAKPGFSALWFVHALHPWVAVGIVPLFFLANGVLPPAPSPPEWLQPEVLGLVVGMAVAKPAGIFIFTWLGSRIGSTRLPEGVTWQAVFGVSLLAGSGLTMGFYVDSLAWASVDAMLNSPYKQPILAGSLISVSAAYWVLRHGGAAKKPAY